MLAMLLMAAPACQSAASPSPAAAPDIVIASDFPTSYPDDYAHQREQIIHLAVSQQATISGFKLGYLQFDDFLGDAPSQAKGVQNVQQMIEDARVLGMIGPWTSPTAYAEIPVANVADLAILGPANTNECLTLPDPSCGAGKPPWKYLSHPNNFFRLAAPEPLQGRAMARYIETLGVKRVAAFNELGSTGTLMIKEFSNEFARVGGKLLFSQDLPSGNKNFKSFLVRANTEGAQAIFAAADFHDGQCAARAQMTGILPSGAYFMGADSMVDWSGGTSQIGKKVDQCINDAVGNADGMLTASSDVDLTHSANAAAVKLVADYRTTFPNSTDIASYTFAIYDCARVLIDAIALAIKANGGRIPTRQQVVDAVAHGQFKGVTGTYSFDAHGDAFAPMMSLYRVENGHWVYVKPIDASAK